MAINVIAVTGSIRYSLTGMLLLYSLTLFLSAALLFLIEPMFAKMILPRLGGTPAVWNTCMVFFQAALLAGYAYTHVAVSRLPSRKQIIVQTILILTPLLVLPIRTPFNWQPPTDANPIPQLLLLLSTAIGLPFFVISTLGPMLQKWFSYTSHPSAKDPYFLYAASNFGSLTGLIGYVVLVEPNFTLTQQSRLWSIGYVVLLILTGLCGWVVWKSGIRNPKSEIRNNFKIQNPKSKIPISRRLRWILLAAVPSSLMLGVTSFLTADVAPVPLLWIIPLALYLITFMVVFARRKYFTSAVLARTFAIAVLLQMVLLGQWLNSYEMHLQAIVIHLFTFFLAVLVCHKQLADDRPDPSHLTEFYLYLSIGGVIGGIVNSLVAPQIFGVVLEYPLALVLVCLLLPTTQPIRFRWIDLVISVILGLVAYNLMILFSHVKLIQKGNLDLLLLTGLVVLCYIQIRNPLRFGLVVGAVLLGMNIVPVGNWRALHHGRSFFGTYAVLTNKVDQLVVLRHGSTFHGCQRMDPQHRDEPLTYYNRSGPIGQVFQAYTANNELHNVAVIGLGAGSLASYCQRGMRLTYYEIDPAIQRVALNPNYFTFLTDAKARGADLKYVLGDARLRLAEAPAGQFDLIVLDAFTGDTVPIHLLTREALQMYLNKLTQHGLLAFHISSRYLDLNEVVADVAADSGLAVLLQEDLPRYHTDDDKEKLEHSASTWVLMARNSADLARFSSDSRWSIPATSGRRPWTDDYSNIIQVIKWRNEETR